MDIPVVIMVEAGLCFLGLGVRPPTPCWGIILNDGYTCIRAAPFMVIFGGLPLVLATLGFTFLGEGLRDYLDPRLKLEAAGMTGSLAARDLSVRYETPQGSVHALRHVDLEASPGEVIGIVGESGCGKSTLVTALANLLPDNARVDGQILYDGVDLIGLDAHQRRRCAATRSRWSSRTR